MHFILFANRNNVFQISFFHDQRERNIYLFSLNSANTNVKSETFPIASHVTISRQVLVEAKTNQKLLFEKHVSAGRVYNRAIKINIVLRVGNDSVQNRCDR